jgi:hypothetical protein
MGARRCRMRGLAPPWDVGLAPDGRLRARRRGTQGARRAATPSPPRRLPLRLAPPDRRGPDPGPRLPPGGPAAAGVPSGANTVTVWGSALGGPPPGALAPASATLPSLAAAAAASAAAGPQAQSAPSCAVPPPPGGAAGAHAGSGAAGAARAAGRAPPGGAAASSSASASAAAAAAGRAGPAARCRWQRITSAAWRAGGLGARAWLIDPRGLDDGGRFWRDLGGVMAVRSREPPLVLIARPRAEPRAPRRAAARALRLQIPPSVHHSAAGPAALRQAAPPAAAAGWRGPQAWRGSRRRVGGGRGRGAPGPRGGRRRLGQAGAAGARRRRVAPPPPSLWAAPPGRSTQRGLRAASHGAGVGAGARDPRPTGVGSGQPRGLRNAVRSAAPGCAALKGRAPARAPHHTRDHRPVLTGFARFRNADHPPVGRPEGPERRTATSPAGRVFGP